MGAALFETLRRSSEERERMETFIITEIEKVAMLHGLYPMNEETKARYEVCKGN